MFALAGDDNAILLPTTVAGAGWYVIKSNKSKPDSYNLDYCAIALMTEVGGIQELVGTTQFRHNGCCSPE
jgi:hypothetical protein